MTTSEVSVLFSEPKIPQYDTLLSSALIARGVSVLFSEPKIPQFTLIYYHTPRRLSRFQCSSASRKFLNDALRSARQMRVGAFQCSSASRKFLNAPNIEELQRAGLRFSALQRAENSSIRTRCLLSFPHQCFSALQRAENSSMSGGSPPLKFQS